MKKEYVSPLFEEVVFMTEDVLTASDADNTDKGGGNGFEENGDGKDDNFDF